MAGDGEEESSILKKLLRGKDSAIVSEFAGKKIVREPVPIEKDEPLKLELRDFIRLHRSRENPASQRRRPRNARLNWRLKSRGKSRASR